jgi:UDP-2,3-diacylglucosamine pyrophosphatase LpxH
MKTNQFRSVFISDVHLGLRKSKKKELLSFLEKVEAENYFFLGDIIDLWQLRRTFTWSKDDNAVFRKILKIAKHKKVVFIPGNHDELFRDFVGNEFLGIKIESEYTHITKNGISLLLIHGDIFDKIILHHKWLAIFGSFMYDVLLELNEANNWIRKKLNRSPWSLSMWMKHKAKEATNMMENFKAASIQYAEKKSCDFIITGHIHKPELELLYANCGDWVENCSAIVENLDGTLGLVFWHDK